MKRIAKHSGAIEPTFIDKATPDFKFGEPSAPATEPVCEHYWVSDPDSATYCDNCLIFRDAAPSKSPEMVPMSDELRDKQESLDSAHKDIEELESKLNELRERVRQAVDKLEAGVGKQCRPLDYYYACKEAISLLKPVLGER